VSFENVELVEISLNNKGEDIILNVDLNTANILLNGTVVGILMFDFKKHIFHRSRSSSIFTKYIKNSISRYRSISLTFMFYI
jgi:frataxin-like iron-binding protein CyaY